MDTDGEGPPYLCQSVFICGSSLQSVEITHRREDCTTDGTDFTDAGRDGAGPAVAACKCLIREIREIRGPIPLGAAGRAAHLRLFVENHRKCFSMRNLQVTPTVPNQTF
jgi:hypothetical protein